jgi:hypothetical protein
MATGAAMRIIAIDGDAAGPAERLPFSAWVDAFAPTADLAFITRVTATAAMGGITLKVDAQDRSACFAFGDISVGASVEDILLETGEFVVAQFLIDGHLPAAKRLIVFDFDVKERVVGAARKDQLPFVTVLGAEHMKQPLVDAGRDQIQICLGSVRTVADGAVARTLKQRLDITVAQFVVSTLTAAG